ncbi:hypothetical protein ACWD33_07720 [Streptomyces xiamenensis]|uniref:Membrane protein n=1 Tax=Streptomyces xiamenensis TaxID=408015 RepID=A0A0F7FTD1_9ACTN|nr:MULTISPECIES: hypothetical protein [Streptomyces]AKG42944.1 membrane protein [Streptomyces xiamenensis]
MTQPPPGPYGSQPPPPHGYGTPQPPSAPYGGPQYGGPQYGGAPYGQVPPQPAGPASGGGNGKLIGITAGVLTLAAALGVGLVLVLNGDDGPSLKDDGTRYTLATPEEVGGYTLTYGDETEDFFTSEEARRVGFTEEGAAMAAYAQDESSEDSNVLFFQGSWGTVTDPANAPGEMFAMIAEDLNEDADEDDRVELVGSPSSMSPGGLHNAALSCQEMRPVQPQSGEPEVSFVCIWSDYSTIGVVYGIPGTAEGTVPLNLERTAELASELRAFALVEVPAGDGAPGED